MARKWQQPPQLRKWRLYRGKTVEGLAEEAGVSPGLISLIENNESNGSPDSLYKLATALKCTVQELFEEPVAGSRRLDILVPEDDYDRLMAILMAAMGRHGSRSL